MAIGAVKIAAVRDFCVDALKSTDVQVSQTATPGSIADRTGLVAGPALRSTESLPNAQVSLPLQAKERAEKIGALLRSCTDRVDVVRSDPLFNKILYEHPALKEFLSSATSEQQYVFGLMIALDQGTTLFDGLESLPDPRGALDTLASTLLSFEEIYQPLGGVLGYHTTVINLMTQSESPRETGHQYLPPPYVDVRIPNQEQLEASYDGISQLSKMGIIFALGGAGDRLNLMDESTGEPLPVARLQFCGRSLLEGLMRDVEALEYWHYRAFSKHVTIPIAIMTSREKQNDYHIESMGRAAHWFGHPLDAIRRMVQPSVPVITTDGQWVVTKPLQLALKPGGHGRVWKLAKDSGSLEWLKKQGIDTAIVRQVHNPLAGLNQNLALLAGYGRSKKKDFGFLSSPSCPGLSEGMNVLDVHGEGAQVFGAISNVEYTQFDSLKTTHPQLFTTDSCPVNANILYVALRAIDESLARNPIPGMIVNTKTKIEVKQAGGAIKKVGAGRLESSMQNIADGLFSKMDPVKAARPEDLRTFLLLQDRSMMKSEIKSAYQPGVSPLATPPCGLYDWNKAMRTLFEMCKVTLPKEQTLSEFLKAGPSVLLTIHPAMGPFWDVIAQKISGGTFADGSEVELEIAELSSKELDVDGSFRLIADVATGTMKETEGRSFTDKAGRAKLDHLTVRNAGVKNRDTGSILHGTIDRKETCEIRLEGFSEVVAENVAIQGDFHLSVPDGKRAILTQGSEGRVVTTFEDITEPGWSYAIEWRRGFAPVLKLVQ